MMNVKKERQDEAEIKELAAKIVEANNAKMAMSKMPPHQGGQSMNILSFLTEKTRNINSSSSCTSTSETKNIDEESTKGNFGWTFLGNVYIPYILRSGESYCAVHIVQTKVLNATLNYMHQSLFSFMNVRSYCMTEAEARLLNEINFKHCDYQFGRKEFTPKDLIISLTDANELYTFLRHCYAKVVNGTDSEKLERCGFIRINRESVVPYTMYNEQKYVPLFYFEGDTNLLQQQAVKLEGWDLSYLKFCFRIQGIRKDLFAHDSCPAISLNDIKNYFPPGTMFEYYWPSNTFQLIRQNINHQQQGAQCPQEPIANPHLSQKPGVQDVNVNTMTGGPTYHSTQPRTAKSAVTFCYPPAQSRLPPCFNFNMRPAPPPEVQANSTRKTVLEGINMKSNVRTDVLVRLPDDHCTVGSNKNPQGVSTDVNKGIEKM
nr:uncharacterized protein LOC111506474 [Leptinotarsa decemlineata]